MEEVMPKIVVITNNEDGHTNWDEAEIRQLHKINKPGHKSHHQRTRDNFNREDTDNQERAASNRTRQNMRTFFQAMSGKII